MLSESGVLGKGPPDAVRGILDIATSVIHNSPYRCLSAMDPREGAGGCSTTYRDTAAGSHHVSPLLV